LTISREGRPVIIELLKRRAVMAATASLRARPGDGPVPPAILARADEVIE
jgi:hypothetical protein